MMRTVRSRALMLIALAVGVTAALLGFMRAEQLMATGQTGATKIRSWIPRVFQLRYPQIGAVRHRAADESAVVAYVRAAIDPDMEIEDVYATRARYADILSMEAGGLLITPTAPEAIEEYERIFWIIGIRTVEPVERYKAIGATGLGFGEWPQAELDGREMFVIMDDLGNVVEASMLHLDNGQGTPLPSSWELEDVENLDEAPPPTPTP